MYYVYILQSKKNKSIYVGFTTDLRRRFSQHNKRLERSTKSSTPRELIYYESFKEQKYALKREKNLKYHGKALGQLKRRIGL